MENDLVINKYEVALFPKDFSTSDFNSLLEEIKKSLVMFADGFNTVIPVPLDAPREIPRILLRSKDNVIACNISLEKVNISWFNRKEIPGFTKSITEINSDIEKLSEILLLHTPTRRMKRVGYIKEYYLVSENPVEVLPNSNIGSKVKENLREFIFQLTYDFSMSMYSNCNKVIILGKGKKQTGEKENVLMLTSDINTLQTKDVSWTTEDIKKFITEADKNSNKNDLYELFLKQDES